MISVIVPVLNGERVIGRQLSALAAQEDPGMPWEVIVVDNGSSDRTVLTAWSFAKHLPRLRVLIADDIRGTAHAMNRGAAESSALYLAFADADDEVGPGWLQAIARALTVSDAVASRFDFETLNRPGLAGRGRPQQDSLQTLKYPPYLNHCGACGLGVHRAIHERIGGFDESCALEDTDYCIRLQLHGYRLRFERDAVVRVALRSGAWGAFKQAHSWARANVGLYAKYGGDEPLSRPWVRWLGGWRSVVRGFARPHDPAAFVRAAWKLGWQLGQLEGALRHRVSPVS